MTPASAKKTFTFLLTILTSYFHGDFFLFFSLFAETKQVFIQSCLVESSRSFLTYLNRLFTRIKHSQNISKYLYSWWEKKRAGGAWGFKIILMMKWWKRPFHEVYCVWGNLCVCWKLHKTLFSLHGTTIFWLYNFVCQSSARRSCNFSHSPSPREVVV